MEPFNLRGAATGIIGRKVLCSPLYPLPIVPSPSGGYYERDGHPNTKVRMAAFTVSSNILGRYFTDPFRNLFVYTPPHRVLNLCRLS